MFLGTVKPLNAVDLACPTFGVGIATSANGKIYTTIGPPYLPIIVPPPQLLSLDPVWKSLCTDYVSFAPGLASFGIFDPPRTLQPVAQLGPDPSVTPSEVRASPTLKPDHEATTPVLPADTPAAVTPRPTHISDPGSSAPDIWPLIPPLAPMNSVNNDPSDVGLTSEMPVGRPNDPSSTQGTNEGTLASPPTNSENTATTEKESKSQEAPQALGELIIGALNGGNFDSAITSNDEPKAATTVIFEGPLLTAGPTGIEIAGYKASPGGVAITVHGTPISLDPSGVVYIDGSPRALSALQVDSSLSSLFTVADKTFTAGPLGFSIGTSRVLPGQGPVLVSGTPIALLNPGLLVIGSSTVHLLPPAQTADLKVYTAGDQAFTADPSGFIIAGTPIVPGGNPVTISGTVVSLNPSGVLLIGTSTVRLPPPSRPDPNIHTVGGQTFTANPKGFVLDGITIHAGSNAATISGTPVSLDTSGVLMLGTSVIRLSLPSTSNSNIHTVGGQIFTANPEGFEFDGTSILPGGSAATISGTPVSLDSSGVLLIGSTSFTIMSQTSLPHSDFVAGEQIVTATQTGVQLADTIIQPGHAAAAASPTTPSITPTEEILHIGHAATTLAPIQSGSSSVFSEGNLTFTAIPLGIIIDGTTLTPGSPVLTIDNTSISLGVGGPSETSPNGQVDTSSNNQTVNGSESRSLKLRMVEGWIRVLISVTLLCNYW